MSPMDVNTIFQRLVLEVSGPVFQEVPEATMAKGLEIWPKI